MKKRIVRTVLIAFLLGTSARTATTVWASNIGAFNYTRRVWQVQDGLAEDVVQAFAQTPDHYFWIGTTAGLVRFDGAEFVTYNSRNVPALSEKSIFCLLAARDGSLWIGTEGGGLVRYRDGIFRLFSTPDGLTNGFVRTVYQDSRDRIWIGTDGGLFQMGNTRIERVDNTRHIPTLAVHAIREDALGGLWVGGSRLFRIEDGRATEYKLRGELSEYRVKSILAERDGTIWVGTVSGLYKKASSANSENNGEGNSHFNPVSGISGTVRALWLSPEGALWIGMIGQGAFVFSEGKLIPLRSPGWLPSNTVLTFLGDSEANIWVGTQHGMLRLSRTHVTVIPLPGTADSDFGTIYADTNHDLWMASSKLFLIHGGIARPHVFPEVAGVRVRNVYRDDGGALWVGTDGAGVIRIVDGAFKHFTTHDGLVNNFVRAFLEGRDGTIWIATDEGVSRWKQGVFTSYQVQDGLCYGNERSLLEDASGDIWIGTERGVSHLRDGKFVNDYLTAKLKDERVWSIHEDADGALWFGTRTDGLFRWKAGRLSHFTTAEGLASDSIYQILEDASHNFWMSGPDGVSRVRRDDLDRAAEHSGMRLAVSLFGISQGLEMTEIYGGTQPSGALAPDGVWFPTSMGAVHISSDAGMAGVAPPVLIDKIVVDGQERPLSSDVSLRPESRKVQFSYTAVSQRSPEDIRFRYKLEGFDQDWTNSGAQRQTSYTNLSPGHYRFRVVAFNMDDPEKISEATLGIYQTPYFYRAWWFVTGSLVLIGGLVWISHLRRLHQVRLRFDAVLEERARVAREMHDTLIQGCVSVSTLLEGISSQPAAAGEERSNLLNYARAQLRLTLDDARRALWNLRRDSTLNSEVGPLLISMADEIAKEGHTRISSQTSGKPYSIPTSQARELLMVTREALYNAVHHSAPSMITLRISFGRDSLAIEVDDDGKGFDPSEARESQSGHYGLIGMRERVERMKGEFMLTSKRGLGTHLDFKVPCKPIFPAKGRPEAQLPAKN